jgi:hypothetical protein
VYDAFSQTDRRLQMWHGLTYVEPSHRPVIHEGFGAAHIIVTNAGPGVVDLMAWKEPMPTADEPPSFKMRMLPGNTRSAIAPMIAVGLSDNQAGSMLGISIFATVAWQMVC